MKVINLIHEKLHDKFRYGLERKLLNNFNENPRIRFWRFSPDLSLWRGLKSNFLSSLWDGLQSRLHESLWADLQSPRDDPRIKHETKTNDDGA